MRRSLLRRLRADFPLPINAADPDPQRSPFWRGGALGAAIFALIVWALAGYYFDTGLPPILMLLLGVLLGGVALAVFALLSLLVAYGSRALPPFFYAAMGGAIGALITVRFVGFRWPEGLYYSSAWIYLWVNALLLGCIWRWWRVPERRSGWLAAAAIALLALDGAGIYALVQDGTGAYATAAPAGTAYPGPAASGVADPAQPGPYTYDYFTYGSGTDRQRTDYADEVRYTTPAVDASRLLPEWRGKKKKWRERYWGFGVDRFPLNGRVWLPAGAGPFPVALIVHGNHGMEDYSDGGYAYLGELLASYGILAVSVDENFINGTWSGDFRGREMPARAWLLLKHLQQWREWGRTPDHPLAGKADLDRVLLIGHSRGGEAVAIAAAYNRLARFPDDATETFDFGFGIRGLVAIAPTDKRYHRRVALKNVSYLTLQGTYDSDESSLFGWRQAGRIRFTDSLYHCKAGVLIHGANHGQFNTTWGRTDSGPPFSWLLNLRPLLAAEAQQRIARVYISAFAQTVFGDSRTYLPLLQEAATGGDWLPETEYINIFRDSRDRVLVDFEEDIDVTTSPADFTLNARHFTVWREEQLQFRDRDTQGNNAVVLGWRYPAGTPVDSLPEYVITLPADSPARPDSATHLLLSLGPGDPDILKPAAPDGPSPNLTIRLEDSRGRTRQLAIADFEPLPPWLRVQYLKNRSLSETIWGAPGEVALESYAIPLDRFTGAGNGFDLRTLRHIRLRMDRDTAGVIVLDDVGFRAD